MKSITLRCLCGSAITLHDDAESLINQDGKADKHGRKFLIEVRAAEYLAIHQKCVDARVASIVDTVKQKIARPI